MIFHSDKMIILEILCSKGEGSHITDKMLEFVLHEQCLQPINSDVICNRRNRLKTPKCRLLSFKAPLMCIENLDWTISIAQLSRETLTGTESLFSHTRAVGGVEPAG